MATCDLRKDSHFLAPDPSRGGGMPRALRAVMVRKNMNELSKRNSPHGMSLFAVAVGIVALCSAACTNQEGQSADAGLEPDAKDGMRNVDADVRARTDALVTTDAPARRDAPVATDAPVRMDALVATDAPIVTDAPVATDAPVTTDAPVATDAPGPSGNVYFSPAPGSVSGAQTICLYSGTSCGDNVAGTAIFYTLDGSPANEASQLYTGPIHLPDPTSQRAVVINAVLVQMRNTTLSGCSSAHPCYGVIVQDGMNVKANLNTNVACSKLGTDSCPDTNFEQTGAVMPPVQHGNCYDAATDDLGVRGVPSAAWYYVSQSQPTVDPYVNSSLSVEMGLAVTSAVDCGPGTAGTGDTEMLIPAIRNENQLEGGSGIGCDTCTSFATSFYVAQNYQGTGGTALDPANLSEMELDQNQVNATYNTATGYGYGTFNMRSSMSHAPSVAVGSNKYGQWEYSTQTVDWGTFPHFFPSVAAVTHDSPMPFGRLAALGATGCPTSSSFTPGITNALYNGGEDSYGLEPGFLLVDQGTPSAESILLTGIPGGEVTGCIRGAGGTTAQSHAAGALASLTVKVQAHATQGVGTGSSGCAGSSDAKNAMYMDYLSLNGSYYGTGASSGPNYQALMGLGLPEPSITVLDTWGTQSVGGVTESKVCGWFSNSSTFGDDKFFNQKQPYTKPGTGNDAKIGIFDMHDNVTASWGIIGSPSQATYTQAP
jgi:Chitobiase/beta-hexosaminidase C-terminal domain